MKEIMSAVCGSHIHEGELEVPVRRAWVLVEDLVVRDGDLRVPRVFGLGRDELDGSCQWSLSSTKQRHVDLVGGDLGFVIGTSSVGRGSYR